MAGGALHDRQFFPGRRGGRGREGALFARRCEGSQPRPRGGDAMLPRGHDCQHGEARCAVRGWRGAPAWPIPPALTGAPLHLAAVSGVRGCGAMRLGLHSYTSILPPRVQVGCPGMSQRPGGDQSQAARKEESRDALLARLSRLESLFEEERCVPARPGPRRARVSLQPEHLPPAVRQVADESRDADRGARQAVWWWAIR